MDCIKGQRNLDMNGNPGIEEQAIEGIVQSRQERDWQFDEHHDIIPLGNPSIIGVYLQT
jgi:hypothetical protein